MEMSNYSTQTVEELQHILRDTEDWETIEAVLAELARRETATPDVSQARADLDTVYAGLDAPLYGEKKRRRRVRLGRPLLAACLALLLVGVVTVSAVVTRPAFSWRDHWVSVDSPQLEGYALSMEQQDGEVSLSFLVQGTDQTTAAGLQRVTLWRMGPYDTEPVPALTYGSDTPGLWAEGQSHQERLVYEGRPDTVYQVEAEIFAEDASGRDTRTVWVTADE